MSDTLTEESIKRETEKTFRYIMRGYDGPREIVSQRPLADLLAESDMLPPQYFRKPANVLRMMWKAMALDIPLDTCLEQVGIMKGKTTVANALILALMRRGGIHVKTIECSNTATILQVTRPGEEPELVEFSMDDAKRAGLVGDKKTRTGEPLPSQYKQRPKIMLFWRAVADAGRRFGSDVTNGMSLYTEEEMAEVASYDDINTAAVASPPSAEELADEIGHIIVQAKSALDAVDKPVWDEVWRAAAKVGILAMPHDRSDPDSMPVSDKLIEIGKAIVALKEHGFAVLDTNSDAQVWQDAIASCHSDDMVDVLCIRAESCDVLSMYKPSLDKRRNDINTATSDVSDNSADTVTT